MQRESTKMDLRLQSAWLALALECDRPRLGYLGVESGGRGRRHLDHNLLLPGEGARVPESGPAASVREVEHGLVYEAVPLAGGGTVDLSLNARGDRALEVSVIPHAGASASFEFVFDAAGSSPSVWSTTAKLPAFPRSTPPGADDPVPPLVNHYGLPLLVHFPDRGFLRIDAEHEVTCTEQWDADPARYGLSLGLSNRGYHTKEFAYHHGRIVLRFDAGAGEELRLCCVVEQEHCPALPEGCGPEWDGLRRCWHNAFTLDRRSLTMGDNPLLGGVAHLAIHFKSEMALYTPELLPGVSLHATLGRALDLGFTHAQGPTGEINWRFSEEHLRNTTEVTGFVDSTPSNLIALHHHVAATGDASLFAKYREGVRRAAAFLLGLEKDGNGMLELPYHGRFFDGADGNRTRNWWDNIAFGHWDACFMLLCHHALVRVEELFAAAGGLGDDVRRIRAWRRRFTRNFHPVFWRPGTRRYAGWVDRDGRAHDYAFTFVNAMAVNEGIVPLRRGRSVLKALLRDMAALGYDGVYGVPGNLVPLAPSDTIAVRTVRDTLEALPAAVDVTFCCFSKRDYETYAAMLACW